jgi:hypothetical protein
MPGPGQGIGGADLFRQGLRVLTGGGGARRPPSGIIGGGPAVQVLARGSAVVGVGALSYGVTRQLKLEEPLVDLLLGGRELRAYQLELARQKELNERLRKVREARIAMERSIERQQHQVDQIMREGARVPGAPPGWLLPSLPAQTYVPQREVVVTPPPIKVKSPSIGGVPVVPGPLGRRVDKVLQKVRPFFQSPLGSALAIGALGSLLGGRSRAGARAPAPAPEDLTAFEPEVVYLGGPFQGEEFAPELDELAELDTEAEPARICDCETVEPKRTKGECRQGYFWETPTSLRLQEWSRRPCR